MVWLAGQGWDTFVYPLFLALALLLAIILTPPAPLLDALLILSLLYLPALLLILLAIPRLPSISYFVLSPYSRNG